MNEFVEMLQNLAIKNQTYGSLLGTYHEFYEGSDSEIVRRKWDEIKNLEKELQGEHLRIVEHVNNMLSN